jgi:hypothetical protein
MAVACHFPDSDWKSMSAVLVVPFASRSERIRLIAGRRRRAYR